MRQIGKCFTLENWQSLEIFRSAIKWQPAVVVFCISLFATENSALAQVPPIQSSTTTQSSQQVVSDNSIAQRFPQVNPTAIPTDITPQVFSGERSLMSRDMQFALLKRLPERLWFNMVTETSQRLETNVFFTTGNTRQDYVYRILPNLSLGYNIFKQTAVYCNWFLLKDVFARNWQLGIPTTQSLSLGFRQDMPLGKRTNLQVDFQARELWQARHLRQADLLPSVNLTRVITPNLILFGSALLQLRSQYYFGGNLREIDPFFSGGFLYRRGQWSFTATTTYVNNFRNRNAIPPINNQTMISDFELSRPVSLRLPSLVTFIRAEPVWNWGAPNNPPGLSGFDFRLFGGLRVAVNKPAYNASVDNLLRQIRESEQESPPATPPSEPKQSSELSPAPLTTSHGPMLLTMNADTMINDELKD